MSQQQKKAPLGTPSGGDDPAKSGMKRQAPPSEGILAQLDGAVKEASKRESSAKKKKRILERCGCL